MEGFALLSPRLTCPCGKGVIEMPNDQRQAYDAALKQIKENRPVRKEPLEDTNEHIQKTGK